MEDFFTITLAKANEIINFQERLDFFKNKKDKFNKDQIEMSKGVTDIGYIPFCESINNRFDKEIERVNEQLNKTLAPHQSSDINNGVNLELKGTTATEKIIYLKELGVLEFLKTKQPFNTSTNSLATILSAITGEATTTLQPYLNAMLSTGVNEKNSPYRSKKTVDKVKQQLNNIGFLLPRNS